jgi:hypothetical protein
MRTNLLDGAAVPEAIPHVTHDPAARGFGDGPFPGTRCYTKASLARYLQLSVRTLDRAIALGLLPLPDLVVSRSPRWTPATIEAWLKNRPRLPGLRKGVDRG